MVLSEARPYRLGNLARGLIGPTPVTILNYTSNAVAAALEALGRETPFDAVQVEGAHLVRYVPVLRAFPGRPPLVCDWHDILSVLMWRYSKSVPSLPRKLYARRTAQLLEGVETEMLRACDAHTVVSRGDQRKLQQRVPSAAFHILENGVDTAYYGARQIEDAYARWAAVRPGKVSGDSPNRVLFVGSMEYYANVDAVTHFASQVWPLLYQRFADLKFTIVGRNPAPEVIALSDHPGIEVTGTVPDVRPYYREAFAVVVPLRVGSGTRLKILEAMAAGVPVVSTTLGAEGLEASPGTEILIGDTAESVVRAIGVLRASPETWRGIVEQGRALVARQYDWDILGDRLYEIHENAIERTDVHAEPECYDQ